MIPVYAVVTSAWELGSDKLPAPAAFMESMAEVLLGFDALPPMAVEACLWASVGIAIPILKKYSSIGIGFQAVSPWELRSSSLPTTRW